MLACGNRQQARKSLGLLPDNSSRLTNTQMEALIFLLLVALVLALVIVVPRYRRKRLLARPFPIRWQQILEHEKDHPLATTGA